MNKCFENIVGVVGCEKTISVSGLWLNGMNGLPGVNVLVGANVADVETQTGLNLLNACVENASQRIITLATEEMSRYWQFQSVLREFRYTNEGIPVSGLQTLTLELNDYCKEYTSYYINSLTFLSTDTQTGVVVQVDGKDYTIDLEANVNYVLTLNASYNEDLTITINGTNIMTGTSFFNGAIQRKCDKDLFFCRFKMELAEPIQFLSAHLYFKECWTTNRYNLDANMNKENAQEQDKYYWNLALSSLRVSLNTIKNFLANEQCGCLRCNDVQFTYTHP